MDINEARYIYGHARIQDRMINELIGLCRGVTADGKVNQDEAQYLESWIVANRAALENPLTERLFLRIRDMLADDVLDPEEAAELFDTLVSFTGEKVETGEMLKSTSLPLDSPAPTIDHSNKRFCFTGTFAWGPRKQCELAAIDRGASVGGLTKKTNYLVIGIYATDSWASSSYGRKIEKAVTYQNEGCPIHIVSEEHWLRFVG